MVFRETDRNRIFWGVPILRLVNHDPSGSCIVCRGLLSTTTVYGNHKSTTGDACLHGGSTNMSIGNGLYRCGCDPSRMVGQRLGKNPAIVFCLTCLSIHHKCFCAFLKPTSMAGKLISLCPSERTRGSTKAASRWVSWPTKALAGFILVRTGQKSFYVLFLSGWSRPTSKRPLSHSVTQLSEDKVNFASGFASKPAFLTSVQTTSNEKEPPRWMPWLTVAASKERGGRVEMLGLDGSLFCLTALCRSKVYGSTKIQRKRIATLGELHGNHIFSDVP